MAFGKTPVIANFYVICDLLAHFTLGPLLIGTSIAASSYVKAMFEQSETLSFGLPFSVISSTWFIFTLIYMVVPNKKVSIKHSAAGALIAAIFKLGKQAFTWYIATFPSYQLIYGAMATLPIMLLWIQISWTVVLLGAQFSRSARRSAVNESNKFRGSKMIALIHVLPRQKWKLKRQIGKGLLVLLGVEKDKLPSQSR